MKRIVVGALIAATATATGAPLVIVDAGHGGSDPGGVGTGMQEKRIVLDVAERFVALLAADTADANGGGEWASALTRSDDTFVSLAARSQYSNDRNADRFMSIHSNAFSNTTANGTETFSYAASGPGAALRNLVQDEMLTTWALTNRGSKTANFAVLRDTAAPAELHELAFITNPADAAKLAEPSERQRAALAHLRALQRHYGLAPYAPAGATDGGAIDGTVYDALGPVEGAVVALDTGEQVTTTGEGSFHLAAQPGTRSVTATAPGHTARTLTAAVTASAPTHLDIELEREPTTTDGGCATGGATGWPIALTIAGAVVTSCRRRRRSL